MTEMQRNSYNEIAERLGVTFYSHQTGSVIEVSSAAGKEPVTYIINEKGEISEKK